MPLGFWLGRFRRLLRRVKPLPRFLTVADGSKERPHRRCELEDDLFIPVRRDPAPCGSEVVEVVFYTSGPGSCEGRIDPVSPCRDASCTKYIA